MRPPTSRSRRVRHQQRRDVADRVVRQGGDEPVDDLVRKNRAGRHGRGPVVRRHLVLQQGESVAHRVRARHHRRRIESGRRPPTPASPSSRTRRRPSRALPPLRSDERMRGQSGQGSVPRAWDGRQVRAAYRSPPSWLPTTAGGRDEGDETGTSGRRKSWPHYRRARATGQNRSVTMPAASDGAEGVKSRRRPAQESVSTPSSTERRLPPATCFRDNPAPPFRGSPCCCPFPFRRVASATRPAPCQVPPTRSRWPNFAATRKPLCVITASAVDAPPAGRDPLVRPGPESARPPRLGTLPYDAFSPHQDLVSGGRDTLPARHRHGDVVIVPISTALDAPAATCAYLSACHVLPSNKGGRTKPETFRRAAHDGGLYARVLGRGARGGYSYRGWSHRSVPMGSAVPLPHRPDGRRDRIDPHVSTSTPSAASTG